MTRIRTIGLALAAVFAVTAVGASAAMAAAPEFTKGVGDTFTVTSGTSTLSGASVTITCKKDSGSGKITTATSVTATVSFEECSGSVLGKACPATISTKELLGDVLELSSTEVGITFKPASGTVFSEFKCEGSTFKVKGTISGDATPLGSPSTTGTIAFVSSMGQGLELSGGAGTATLIGEEDETFSGTTELVL